MRIEARGIRKRFGAFVALDGVSLTVENGRLVALLGPSGSGKTSLLRILAGLEDPDEGTVLLDGVDGTRRDVRERHVGFVFQHYALFRRLSVFENVAFGLRVKTRERRPSEAAIRERVMALLSLVQLDFLRDRLPSELSGGQRQRVALARALAVEPKVLLLDEPFGSLDARVRLELRRWLRRLHDEIQLTSVFVTHDHEEALEVADRVVLLNAGRIEQEASPRALLEEPASAFVLEFLGSVTVLHGHARRGKAVFGPLSVDCPEHAGEVEVEASLYVRAHELELSRERTGEGGFWAVVRRVQAAGAFSRVDLSHDGLPPVRAEVSRERLAALNPAVGETLWVSPASSRLFLGGETSGDDLVRPA